MPMVEYSSTPLSIINFNTSCYNLSGTKWTVLLYNQKCNTVEEMLQQDDSGDEIILETEDYEEQSNHDYIIHSCLDVKMTTGGKIENLRQLVN